MGRARRAAGGVAAHAGAGCRRPPVAFTPAPGSPITVGSNPEGIATGDFNSDGKPDLAVTNVYNGSVSVLLGNGNGSFQPATTVALAAGSTPVGIVTGDFNGDGKPDLAMVNFYGNNVSVLLNSSPVDLALTATSTPTATVPGGMVTYTRVRTRTGADTGATTVTLALDPSLAYQSAAFTGGATGTATIAPGVGERDTTPANNTATVHITVNPAIITVTAPTGGGSGNSGSATRPVVHVGAMLPLTAQIGGNAATGVTYTSSDPTKVAVNPATGVGTALHAGTVTITGTGPNRATGSITVTVLPATGTGLMAPGAQPMAHVEAPTVTAPPAPQPLRH